MTAHGAVTSAHGAVTPRTFRPRAPLDRYIDYFGYLEGHRGPQATGVHRSRALPRGAFTVVFDVGACDTSGFDASGHGAPGIYAADGITRASPAPSFAVGAGTQSFVTCLTATQTVLTVHCKPAGARPFIGMPADELRDHCVSVDDLWGRAAVDLRHRLIEEPAALRRVALVEAFLLSRIQFHGFDGAGAADTAEVAVSRTLSAVEANPALRVSDICDRVGLSPKAFGAAFRARVGLTPKAYLRVRRLQSALRRLDGRGVLGADLAAELGYFDQPHLVREFRALAQTTPTAYLQARSAMPGHVDLAD